MTRTADTYSDLTPQDLLRRISAGDTGAMKVLYDSLAPDLTRFLTLRTGDAVEAADLLHETMMDVWNQADRYEGRGSLRAWIFSIARNKAVDRLRKARRNVLTDAPPDIPDEAPDPSETLLALEDAGHLHTCIKALSPAHRAVIHLAFFEDLSYEDIAKIENCPVGTVKTRIFHAKKLLMHCISGQKHGA